MRIGLIGVCSLNGEHYFNLIEAVLDGHIDELVLCDNNREFLPKASPRFESLYAIPPQFAYKQDPPGSVQAFHHIYKNARGGFPKMYDDFEKMLAAEKLDGVIIGSPNWMHERMAVPTLTAGIPTLCEKPLATTMTATNNILDAAKDSGTYLQLGVAFRWRQSAKFLKSRIDAGAIGDLRMAWGQEFRGDWKTNAYSLGAEDAPSGNWRYSEKYSGGSILEKLCHDLDFFQWMIGAAPVKATAYGGAEFFGADGRETIDNAVFLVEYEGGMRLSYDYCMAAPYSGRYKGRYFGFIGQTGMIEFDEIVGEAWFYDSARPRAVAKHCKLDPDTLPGHHAGNNTRFALMDLLAAIRDGVKDRALPALDDTRHVMKIAFALQESVKRDGETIRLDSFDPE